MALLLPLAEELGVSVTELLRGERTAGNALPAEEVVESTRGRLLFQVPVDLPAGQYYMRVASQCTTNPAPMKSARTYDYPVPLDCE